LAELQKRAEENFLEYRAIFLLLEEAGIELKLVKVEEMVFHSSDWIPIRKVVKLCNTDQLRQGSDSNLETSENIS
jgi:hypothetical protein